MLNAFCKHTGLDASQVAAVGDNTHDLGMGRSGGAGATIAVMTGTGVVEDLQPLADFIFPSIVEFGAALQDLGISQSVLLHRSWCSPMIRPWYHRALALLQLAHTCLQQTNIGYFCAE
jgi:hypothetical protein